MSGTQASDAPRRGGTIVRVYLASTALFTLAMSVIWGVNTLFLLHSGLSLFQVMLVNSMFSGGQLIFEVPTGVVADTIGRRFSYLLGIGTLFVATLMYVASARYGWGMTGFIVASILIGFGYTCQTGAVDAWLVDALDSVGYEMPREQVFARAGVVNGLAMLVGTLGGGFLGQVDLSLPYLVRAGILLAAFVLVTAMMREIGFQPRPLKVSRFAEETRHIADAGMRYGWRHPVVRPLLFVSLVQGSFMMYFFYSSQPFALKLLGHPDLIWVAGALTALLGLAGVVGNLLVRRIMAARLGKDPARLLAVGAVVGAVLIAAIGLIGVLAPAGGSTEGFVGMLVVLSAYGVVFGIVGPVRQAYINRFIPTAQRATVLSLDSFFGDAGGLVGQPGFGWFATRFSIGAGYVAGSFLMALAGPLYVMAGRAERRRRKT